MAKGKNKSNTVKSKSKASSLGFGFFVIPIILLIFIYAFVFSIFEDKSYIYISPVFKTYNPISKSETDKKLENYFTDETGLFYDEERFRLINESEEYFYEKTGVRIYFYATLPPYDENNKEILPTDEEALETCKHICEEMKNEGIDLVVLFLPVSTGFECWTYATDEVRAEFGSKLETVLRQSILHNFHVVGEYDELVWYSYREAADRIMGGFTSPFTIIKENLKFFVLLVITIAVIVPFVVVYIRKNKIK